MEILLLHPGALGDIILSFPAIALLRKRFPSAGITLAANVDHIAPIISGYADRAVALSTLPVHRLYIPEPPLPEDMHFWKSFDRIVSWTGCSDSGFVRKMKEIHSDASVEAWHPMPGEHRHVSQLFARSLGFEIADRESLPPVRIHLDSAMLDQGLQWLAKREWNDRDSLIALHPGAGSREKRWPLSQFASLARHLALQGKRKLLIIEGPAEPGLASKLARELPSGGAILAESVPLGTLAAVLQRCAVFIGNDSGIAHLAAGLSVPSVVLFGPSLPQHWAPLGRHVVVLRNRRDCEGCASGRNNHTCLDNLTTDDVLRSAVLN